MKPIDFLKPETLRALANELEFNVRLIEATLAGEMTPGVRRHLKKDREDIALWRRMANKLEGT